MELASILRKHDMICTAIVLCATLHATEPRIVLPDTDEAALHNGRSSDAWFWEPTHVGQWQVPLAGVLLTFIVQFVPEDVRRDISREVWGYLTGTLHRPAQQVTGHPRQANSAWVGLNIQGYDSDGNGDVDSYGDWDEADYDDDGRTDYTSAQANATTAHGVAVELETQLYYVDAYLRQRGR